MAKPHHRNGAGIGQLYGVGTGPGDPDLLTIKAARLLGEADVIAYFAKAGNTSNALRIVETYRRADMIEIPLLYPVTTESHRHGDAYRKAISAFYDKMAEQLAEHLSAGKMVVVLSEGDPLFYGSYMHLHVRLARHFPTEVVPGITAMSGCWSLAGLPIVQGDDMLTVLPGTLDEEQLASRLSQTEAAIIMKIGRNLPKVRNALIKAGRLDQAVYVERGTMAEGHYIPLSQKLDDEAPYFSLVLVPGWAERSGQVSHEALARATHIDELIP
ncbi:precorrin-2 C(20)-methyltransferase [Notoacmeibacter sp. MSK16QG-6]|uniref:precorrin-2 C(20)-methyltransferase n=1 Tax=Notoacmeibacter sp. MSK16QG-6 TaxID=2957982 RepID=UPI00209E5A4A|nr:precorrin-2 C(20)-methyltransferase [Notoacmeibacter sp. MSK16QG-6]MCP1199789.1 precorrin-2 C(20)-methyltransferase [Notoacmeibacter sp. MSK16QG-6]